jgi:hypothetical protein
MVATHKTAIQLYLVAESCTICSSRSRRPVRKLLDTSLYEPYMSIYPARPLIGQTLVRPRCCGLRGCIQEFPDWLPGARTANGTAFYHHMQLYRYSVSQSNEFCRHNPLCCSSTSVHCCCLFRYGLSLETFGYASYAWATPSFTTKDY